VIAILCGLANGSRDYAPICRSQKHPAIFPRPLE
jgi:hypothetical protein